MTSEGGHDGRRLSTDERPAGRRVKTFGGPPLRLPSTTADILTDGHTRYSRDEQDPSRWWVCDSAGRRFASLRLGALLDTAQFHGLTVRAG